MSKLLFLPLDVEILNTDFELGEPITFRQPVWDTRTVINTQNYSWLLNQLSLDIVTSFAHKVQIKEVGPHLDVFSFTGINDEIQHYIDNEPAGFHVVLKGNSDSLEIYNGSKWVNPILPNVPMAYLMNLTSCIHRVKEDHMRETLYIKGIINKSKHEELINRSLEKYSHLAVYQE